MTLTAARVAEHVRALTTHPDRHVGGEGNREATDYFARTAEAAGLEMMRLGVRLPGVAVRGRKPQGSRRSLRTAAWAVLPVR